MRNRFRDDNRLDLCTDRCVYCGESANSIEHWPPAYYTGQGYLFSACLECNLTAGFRHPFDFEVRAKYVLDRYRVKYTKLLASTWTLEEIEELDGHLQEGMRQWRANKQRLLRRIAWNAISYIRSIDRDNIFAPVHVDRKLTTSVKERSTEKWSTELQSLMGELKEIKREKRIDREFRKIVFAEFGEEMGREIVEHFKGK